MATTLQGYNMPPGFSLHMAEPGDAVPGYWVSYVAPDGSGDIEASDQEHEGPEDAVIEAWAWYAAELMGHLRFLARTDVEVGSPEDIDPWPAIRALIAAAP